MSNLELNVAKTGQQTCTINGIRLHSAYDPIKEAQRFVSSLDIPFTPSLIVITEPALSYCSTFLRQSYPQAILVAIRFTHDFDAYNHLWDKVVYHQELIQLLQSYGEDMILATAFFSWQPSQQVFPQEYNHCWQQIRTLVQTSRDILGTRAYFGKRWLKNTLSFCTRLQNTSTIKSGSAPVLLVASGPSLKSSIHFIQKYREAVFVIALSSALSPLLAVGIEPDLCISTDGGYWAKKHIVPCPVPLALPAEAALPAALFEKNIIPLTYADGPEAELLNICKIPRMPAFRNGTVSGTALELALSITTGPVFACGLDLASTIGFQHCQPNCLETAAATKDCRLAPKETRLYPPQLPSQSLQIYAQWFASQSNRFKDRFYRLSDSSYQFSNKLGTIKDIHWEDFSSMLKKLQLQAKNKKLIHPAILCQTVPPQKQRYEILLKTLETYQVQKLPDHWISTLLPAEQALLSRSLEKTELEEKITEKSTKYMKEMIHYLQSMGEK